MKYGDKSNRLDQLGIAWRYVASIHHFLAQKNRALVLQHLGGRSRYALCPSHGQEKMRHRIC